MPKIIIENLNKKILDVTGSSKTLLFHFHDHGLDWMHACGGKGRCTTCKVNILRGIDNFGPPTEAELKFKSMGALLPNERLACQATISGDVCIATPNEYKLPHLKYSD